MSASVTSLPSNSAIVISSDSPTHSMSSSISNSATSSPTGNMSLTPSQSSSPTPTASFDVKLYILPPITYQEQQYSIPEIAIDESPIIIPISPTPTISPSKRNIARAIGNEGETVGFASVLSGSTTNIVVQVGEVPADPNVISPVVDVIAVDSTGSEIIFDGEAEICVEVSNTQELTNESCLGFFDLSLNPPKWICEDPCITIDYDTGEVCGVTTHFTSFAVLLAGGGRTGTQCESSYELYIFDEAWQDLILLLCTSGFIVCVVFSFGCFLAFSPFGKRIMYGEEGSRIKKVRSARSKSGYVDDPFAQL